ncbi:hypothetical protein L9F63_004678, partial [Diploptera punctata]
DKKGPKIESKSDSILRQFESKFVCTIFKSITCISSENRVSTTILISSYSLTHDISRTVRHILHTCSLGRALDAAQLVVKSMHSESGHCVAQFISSLSPFTV